MQNRTKWLCVILRFVAQVGLLVWIPLVVDAAEADDEQSTQAIRQAAADFSEAFNAHDARRVAEHFTDDADFISDTEKVVGRSAIQKRHEEFFAKNPKATIYLAIDSIRVFGDTAVEDGRAVIGPMPEEAEAFSKYTAIHVKKEGQWLLASVRDNRIQSPVDGRHLRDLNWLVGAWSAANGDVRLDVKCRWLAGERYLIRTFNVHDGDKVTQSGMQVIGWDPLSQHVVSWLFDSTGGHAVGLWSPSESGWTIGSSGITRDGTPTSATNSFRRVDDDSLAWKSIDRRMGNSTLPDLGDVVLKRVKTAK